MKIRFPLSALLAVWAAQVSASTVIYNTESQFLSAIKPNYYLEDFTGWTLGTPLDGSQTTYLSSTINGYQWRAAADNGLFSVGPPDLLTPTPIPGISTFQASNNLSFTFTSGRVSAFGGIFSAQDENGNVIPRVVTITLDDGTTQTITGSGFVGFASTTSIRNVILSNPDQDVCDVELVCNFSVASHLYTSRSLTDMPEPATPALLAAGVAALGLGRRRKPGRHEAGLVS